MTRPRASIVVALALVSLAACRRDPRRREVEDVLRRYDRAIIEAHLTGKTDALAPVASDDEQARVSAIIVGLKSEGKTLFASLEDFELDEVKDAEDGKLLATTRERWTYEHTRDKRVAPASPSVTREYFIRYTLKRKDGGWIVVRTDHASPSKEVR